MRTLVIAALVAVVSIAVAQPFDGRGAGRGQGRGFGPGDGAGMREHLGLDSATAVKIDKMRDEFRKNQIALRAKLQTARVEFRAAMRKDPADEKAAMARQKEMSSIREQLQAAALEHRFAVQKLLTPEQRAMMRDRGGRWMNEDGRWFGRGDRDGRGGCDGCCRGNGHGKHRRGSRGGGWDRGGGPDRDDD